MPPQPPHLLAYVVDPNLHRVLERALRGRGVLLSARTPAELRTLAEVASPDAILVDLSRADDETSAIVPAIALRYPLRPLLLYTPLNPERAAAVLRIAQRCPTSLVLLGYDDCAAGLTRFLRNSLGSTTAAGLVTELTNGLATDVRQVVTYCVARLDCLPSVRELAFALGMSQKTLGRRIRRECGMSTGELLGLIRILVAAWLIRTSNLSLQLIAERTGFANNASLSRSIRRRLGMTSSEIRRSEGFHKVLVVTRSRLGKA